MSNDILNPESYVLPEAVTESRVLWTAAKNLRIGDVLVGKGDRKINYIKTGTKRVTAQNETGKEILYVLLEDEVEVQREVETEESRKDREATRVARSLAGMYQMAQSQLPQALEKVNAEAASGLVGKGALEDLMMAQSEARVWAIVARFAENRETIVEAVADVKSSFLEEITWSATRRTSRSTSTVSNLLEDIEVEAKAKFVQRVSSRYEF